MAGAGGFEPTHDGIKTRCLTAWLRPNKTYNRNNLIVCYLHIVKHLLMPFPIFIITSSNIGSCGAHLDLLGLRSSALVLLVLIKNGKWYNIEVLLLLRRTSGPAVRT